METETKKRKPSWVDIGWFVATVGIVLLLNFIDLSDFLASDWSAEYSATVARLLPPYVAACLLAAILAVFIGLRRFPKHIAFIAATATVLVLTGGFVQMKIVREADTRQARIEEANMLADEILSLRGVPADRLEEEARVRLRKIAVSMYGEVLTGDMFLKPEAAEARSVEKEATR
jgi:hypothetical protein